MACFAGPSACGSGRPLLRNGICGAKSRYLVAPSASHAKYGPTLGSSAFPAPTSWLGRRQTSARSGPLGSTGILRSKDPMFRYSGGSAPQNPPGQGLRLAFGQVGFADPCPVPSGTWRRRPNHLVGCKQRGPPAGPTSGGALGGAGAQPLPITLGCLRHEGLTALPKGGAFWRVRPARMTRTPEATSLNRRFRRGAVGVRVPPPLTPATT